MNYYSVFDKWVWLYDPFSRIFGRHSHYYETIKSLVPLRSSDIVLDVGGGTGLMAEFLCDDVAEVVVLDPSIRMLGRIKNNKIKGYNGVAQKIEYPDEYFNLVYCIDALHHFANGCIRKSWDNVIQLSVYEMLRVLKEGGNMLIFEFDPSMFGGKVVEFFENRIMRWNSFFHTPRDLETILSPYSRNIELVNDTKYSYVFKITK